MSAEKKTDLARIMCSMSTSFIWYFVMVLSDEAPVKKGQNTTPKGTPKAANAKKQKPAQKSDSDESDSDEESSEGWTSLVCLLDSVGFIWSSGNFVIS